MYCITFAMIFQVSDLTPVTKTEFSTFTYLITSVRDDGNTLVETDIVVSSNIVTGLPSVEPTPLLDQVSVTHVMTDQINWEFLVKF